MDEQDWALALGEVMGWTSDHACPWVGTTSLSWTCLQSQVGGGIPPTSWQFYPPWSWGDLSNCRDCHPTYTLTLDSLQHSPLVPSWWKALWGIAKLAAPSNYHLYFVSPSFSPSKEWIICLCESEVAQSCPTLCNPVDCSVPGSSVHGIL